MCKWSFLETEASDFESNFKLFDGCFVDTTSLNAKLFVLLKNNKKKMFLIFWSQKINQILNHFIK